jgi:hypothetical protein
MLCTEGSSACETPPVAGGAQDLSKALVVSNNTDMNHTPPPEDKGPATTSSLWVTTTPSKFLDDPIPPRRVPPQPYPQRKPQPQALTPKAHVWLARLPPRYQPLATARRHPHIVNHLCELWNAPAQLPDHFRELMLSSRPGQREGFAFEVLTELADLQAMVELMLKGEKF